jgi:hypothetical protein
MSYRVYAYIDELAGGVITQTMVTSDEKTWPWVPVPEEVNTYGVRAWRLPQRDGEWQRRIAARMSVSRTRIIADGEDYAEVLVFFSDESEKPLWKNLRGIRVRIEDTVYQLDPGDTVKITATEPKRIAVKLLDPRVYVDRPNRDVLAVDEADPLAPERPSEIEARNQRRREARENRS